MANEKETAINDIKKALKKVLPFKILCDKNNIKLSEAANSITDFVKNNPNVTEEEFDELCHEIDNLNKNNIDIIANRIIELRLK